MSSVVKDQFGFGTEKKPYRMDLSDKSFKEIQSLAEDDQLDIGKYFNSGAYQEWLSKPWKKEDLNFLRVLISKTAKSYKDSKPFYVPKSSWNEEYMENYKKIITLASNKKGAPKPEEIHNRLRRKDRGNTYGD